MSSRDWIIDATDQRMWLVRLFDGGRLNLAIMGAGEGYLDAGSPYKRHPNQYTSYTPTRLALQLYFSLDKFPSYPYTKGSEVTHEP